MQLVETQDFPQRRHVLRNVVVVVAVVILTTLGITASDRLSDTLGARLLTEQNDTRCPRGMVFVSDESGFCIDRYEVSAGEGCFFADPRTRAETQLNLDNPDCSPLSVEGVPPWAYISQHQAQLACAKAGKHLASSREWYLAALGTPDTDACNMSKKNSAAGLTGTLAKCLAASGAFDMLGNVWEWIDGVVVDGRYRDRAMPPAGYITAVDEAGIPIATSLQNSTDAFKGDYLWLVEQGAQGMLRGGYFGSGADAGLYSIYAASPPSFTGATAGFRCVK